jgi:ubiquinone/menaquinone biosynthesis C-methylase UbiE
MDHRDHVALLRPGVEAPGGTWADLGAGEGAFTLALAELLGPGATLYAVDHDGQSLRRNAQQLERRYSATTLRTVTADFTQPLDLPQLDGVVMANSLHFVSDKTPVVRAVRSLLKPGGALLLVEYNVDRGNRWVPYPLSFTTWQKLATAAGFGVTTLLATRPSRFLGEIYAAQSL